MSDLTVDTPALSPAALRDAADQAVAALKVLANTDRLLLLCHLSQGECCVSDMEAHLGITQPTLSQQLAVLRQEGLVDTEKEGKFVYYRLASDDVVRIMRTLWDIYCAPK